MRNNKKKSIKLEKRNLTVDEVLIQSALIMVKTVSDTKRGGATVKFETEVEDEKYHIDITIKRIEKEEFKKKELKKV